MSVISRPMSLTERFLDAIVGQVDSWIIEFVAERWNDPDDIDYMYRCSLCKSGLEFLDWEIEAHCKLHLDKLVAESALIAAAYAAWMGGDLVTAKELGAEALKAGVKP